MLNFAKRSLLRSPKSRSPKSLLGCVLCRGVLCLGIALGQEVKADEPNFDFLNAAQWLHDEARFVGTTSDIELVQFESATDEVLQPADTGSRSRTSQASDSSELFTFNRPNLSEIARPALSSADAPAAAVDTPAQLQAVQQITQRVETGVSETAPVNIIPASTFNLVSVPDAAQTIVEVANNQTVKARRRSPIGFDARIRGYYEGQIYTTLDGAYQTPVRGDLDATLTKFDSSLIGSTEVISGPYGLRYGSGFSFLNVSTIPTPRYEGGRENHVRLGTNVRANGGQTYNTATLLGGSRRSGYFASVGFRKGSDYSAGNGLEIPSSYDAFNLFSGFGFDVGRDTKMETKVSFLQQGDTEYAGQFFDVNDLDHYGINHSIIHKNDDNGFGSRTDLWFSTTDFNGNTDFSGKRRNDFPVLQRVDAALFASNPTAPANATFSGDVDGKLTTAGIRSGVTKEYSGGTKIGGGADFRYVRQTIGEQYDISKFEFPDAGSPTGFVEGFESGMPTAEVFDPGFYVEASADMTDYWRTAVGARLAFATSQASASDVQPNSNFRAGGVNEIDEDLDVSDILGSFYITNDVELTEHWRSRVGMGYAERLPNLTDRYSDGLFLAVIQSGFSRVIGDPTLSKERNWQVDFRVDSEHEFVRTRLSAFHSWILDYVTYAANNVNDPMGARLLQAVNTDYATLAGFEAYGEADLLDGVQAFASLSYLEGRDQEINQPLSGISPLESRLGIRLTDTSPKNGWGLEWGWRFVDNQDRLGTLRPVNGGTGVVGLETATPGFTVSYLRGYLRPSERVSVTGGIENMFDRNYYEHLNLRLPADNTTGNNFGESVVLSPGFTPYVGLEIEY